MSRVANNPVTLPKDVEARLNGRDIMIKGAKGNLQWKMHDAVDVKIDNNVITCAPVKDVTDANVVAGTTRAIINNMVVGVSQGFEKKLNLVGVGYRAQIQGSNLNLGLGFSYQIVYPIPKGVTVETPSQTEVFVKGIDKQLVGQVAAEIRAYRPPEPYKGKGIRYADEVVHLKEGKKK